MSNKQIAKAWFAAIDAKDFSTVRSLMAADHSFTNPMTPAPVGIEEHIGMMQMMTSSFVGGHSIDQIIEEGNTVVARGTYTGIHNGEFNGIPATGKQVTFSWIDIFQIADGKVSAEFFEMNPLAIMSQIGAVSSNA